MAAVEFNPFIVSTSVQKTDAKTRKLIRRHVMLGKNSGKRRGGGKPKRSDGDEELAVKSSRSSSSSDEDTVVNVPVKVGDEYSFFKLAENVDPLLVSHFLQFSSDPKHKASLFPLGQCIAFTNHREQWVTPIAYDSLYLHAIIFGSQAAMGFGSFRDSNGSPASEHFGKAVGQLRLRLAQDDPIMTTADTTLMTMMILAMAALLAGQIEVARTHMIGVRRIVDIRGGFASFADSVKLLIDLLRCDIGLALTTGQAPLFFHRPFAGPQRDSSPTLMQGGPVKGPADFELLLPSLDQNLARIWRCLRDFCKTVNTASKTHRRLSEQAFLDNMASNIYPLLNLQFEYGSISEACRLALLAFCSNAFLQFQGMNVQYIALPSQYRQSLLGVAQADERTPPAAMLWFLMMGGIALFTGEEDQLWLLPWLRDVFDECEITSWEEVKDSLKPFLWVDMIHDRRGERIYDAVMALDVP